MSRSTRRTFLKTLGAGTAATGLGSILSASEAPNIQPERKKAQSILFLVSDGMNHGTLQLLDVMLREQDAGPSSWMQLYQQKDFPIRTALQDTASASSVVTDSAAAASAWGSGVRVNNGALNISPKGASLRPILPKVKEAGMVTGLISTARITHATPAGFSVQSEDRDREDEIAAKYLDSGVDILMGGGSRHFDPEAREDGRDLFKEFEGKGYYVARESEDLLGTRRYSGRILGTFSDSHIPYLLDRPSLSKPVPGLMEMSKFVLNKLTKNARFFLQIEAARVDHAGHANDPASILNEQAEFDSMVFLANMLRRQRPDLMTIVTTDHGTGGCQINGAGQRYNDTAKLLNNINSQKTSFEVVGGKLAKVRTREAVKDILDNELGYNFSKDTLNTFMEVHGRVVSGEEPNPYALANALSAPVSEQTAVGWTSHNHTGDPVELVAFGPGSELIPPYFENYELHNIMLEALGIPV